MKMGEHAWHERYTYVRYTEYMHMLHHAFTSMHKWWEMSRSCRVRKKGMNIKPTGSEEAK